MAQSNLDSSYISTWKSITGTSVEPTVFSPLYHNVGEQGSSWRPLSADMYEPVTIAPAGDDKPSGRIDIKLLNGTTKGTPVLGVLGECFQHKNVPHKVIVQGIVPMMLAQPKSATVPAASTAGTQPTWATTGAGEHIILPGDLVTFGPLDTTNFTGSGGIRKAAAGDWAFGIALTKGAKAYATSQYTQDHNKWSDWIAVLLCRGGVQ